MGLIKVSWFFAGNPEYAVVPCISTGTAKFRSEIYFFGCS